MKKSCKVATALEKLCIEGDFLCNFAIENGYLICVRNIEGHFAPKHTVGIYQISFEPQDPDEAITSYVCKEQQYPIRAQWLNFL